MGAAIGFIGPALSIGGSLASMFGGGGADDVQLPQAFQMPMMNQAANSAFNLNTDLGQYNTAAQSLPQYQAIAQRLQQNPYAQAFQSGAGGAGGLGQMSGLNMFGAGNALTGGGFNLLGYVDPIMQQAFDPQSALYNRTLQQVTDQARASQAARGINMTPYGAGLENQAVGNFNIDWQNQLLNRMATGAQAAGNLTSQGGQAIIGGQGLAGQAPGQFLQGSLYPYSAFNTIGNDQFGALNQLSSAGQQAAAIPQQQIGNWLSYLGRGNESTGQANAIAKTGLAQSELGFNQQQALGRNLGAGLNGLQNANWGWLNSLF